MCTAGHPVHGTCLPSYIPTQSWTLLLLLPVALSPHVNPHFLLHCLRVVAIYMLLLLLLLCHVHSSCAVLPHLGELCHVHSTANHDMTRQDKLHTNSIRHHSRCSAPSCLVAFQPSGSGSQQAKSLVLLSLGPYQCVLRHVGAFFLIVLPGA